MRVSVFIAVLLLIFASGPKDEIKLELGSVLPSRYLPKKSKTLYMTSSAQLDPYVETTVEGITYLIAYKAKTRVITYISTHDKNFRTSDDLCVGSHINVGSEQILVYPGWEIRGPKTKDGWYPLIGFNSELRIVNDGAVAQLNIGNDLPLKPGQMFTVSISGFAKSR